MKRMILALLAACCLHTICPAQTGEKAKYLIDGLFFSQIPPDCSKGGFAFFMLKDDEGGVMFYLADATLSEKDRACALPASSVPDAGKWLREAEVMNGFLKIREEAAAGPALQEGEKIKPFRVEDTEGRTWTRESTAGKPLVLNFWYTGCAPCIREMPELGTWPAQYPGVNFLAVTYNRPEEIRDIVRKRDFRFVQVAGDRSLWKMFGVQATPTTVVLDSEGVVRKIVTGTNQQKRDELLECIRSLSQSR